MHRYLVSFSIIAALASGCAYDAEPDPDAGEPGLLRIDVDAEALDPSRIRIGLFRTDGPGIYTTAEGTQQRVGLFPYVRANVTRSPTPWQTFVIVGEVGGVIGSP